MKKFFFLWLVWGGVVFAHAQTVTVTNKETGEPIEMAVLMSETPQVFATTNARGQADISAFKGSERLEIRTLGYQTQVQSYAQLEALGFVVVLEPTAISLDGVVVSATRWQQSFGKIPFKIATISTKEMALQNPQTAADLLGFSGKVFIQKSQQGGGSPMIRGFATNRLLYAIDGVRMNTAIFRGGNLQNVISLDAFAMENVEVLFGAGSVMYGSDAIGGVMSFRTLTPQVSLGDKPLITGKAVARYASANNEKTGHFDINVGGRKWAFGTSLSYNDFGDLRMGSHGPEEYLRPFYVQRIDSTDVVVTNDDPKIQRPSGYKQMNLMQKVRFRPNEKWDFQYGFHYSETSDYARYDRHIRYRNGLPRYGEWYYGPQKWLMNQLTVQHNGENVAYDQMTLRLAHQAFEESRISRNINQPNREIRVEKVAAISMNLDFQKKLNPKNTLFYGVEIVGNEVVSTGINENISTGEKAAGAARYPQATWASYGGYLTDEYNISDKFVLQGGLRYNQFALDATFDTTFYPFPFTTANLRNDAWTGSLGVVFRPTDQWGIRATLATAFRSPNVDDVGKVFDSEQGTVTVPNPELEAEYAYNADFSLVRTVGEVAKIELTGYFSLLQNALVRRNFMLNGLDSIVYDGTLSQVQAIQNAAVATVYGVQASLEVKLSDAFSFSSDFNYQVGEEELDDGTTSPSRHAPPAFGTSKLSYNAHQLNLQLYAVYSAGVDFENLPEEEKGKTEIYAVDTNGNPYSPAWYSLNFKAMYQVTPNFAVSTGVENLTDQRYRPYSSGIVASGRNFILSVRCNF